MLEIAGGIKQWEMHGGSVPLLGLWASGMSLPEIGEPGDTWGREEIWALMDPDPDSLLTGQRVGLCENLGAC